MQKSQSLTTTYFGIADTILRSWQDTNSYLQTLIFLIYYKNNKRI